MAEVPEEFRTALRGRYDLERELGRGGMAVVYLAHDLRYDRLVAIKVLNPELAASVGRARFLREIDIAARLTHPHILSLLDSGEAGGLLYYVMPYVEGESLKDRIQRETQLRVSDVISIARDVAAALDHAHAQGYVHRDVKPGNVLLTGGSAVVTDFGIARAVRRSATDDTLTDVNLAIGTPHYMSPEQWAGTRELDARSDIYSLGCVVYEMLAGEPPFTGPTMDAIAARVAFDPPPPLRTVRPKVSPALEQAIMTALEKVPADRFTTAGEFARKLEKAAAVAPPPPPPLPLVPLVLAGVFTVGAVLLTSIVDPPPPGPMLDTTRYAILPFRYAPGITPRDDDQRLLDAIRRWRGVGVEDGFNVREAIGSRAGSNLSASDALVIARELGAGRYVRAEVSRRGDSLHVRGFLYDAASGGRKLHDAAVDVDTGRTTAGPAFSALADSLLLHGSELPARRVSVGTMSLPARQAYATGHRAIEEWDLTAADSAFAAAARFDDQYAQAFLWLAQVRAWSVAPPEIRGSTAMWRSPAERAAVARDRLTASERVMAEALVAAARGQLDRACPRWRALSTSDSLDFVAWYGLGSCLASDEAVVPDRRSPSGWRFRASYAEAMRAYQRAYQLLPSVHRALRARSYQSVRALLYTRNNMWRHGHGVPPDTSRFAAYPEWQGDSLAFIPHRDTPGKLPLPPATRATAVRRQRRLFHEIALGWVAAYPRSADAMEALALALEMLGDPAGLDTLRHARALTTTPAGQVRTAVAEVWMRVRRSVPDDIDGLRLARALADSLLGQHPPRGAPEPQSLAGLAALTGRAARAAAYIRETEVRQSSDIEAQIAVTAPALLMFAAIGGPADSLQVLERALVEAIRQMPPDERDLPRARWLARAASLAFPYHRFATLQELSGIGDYLVDAQVAFARGDAGPARQMFAVQAEQRRITAPEDITLDAVYPEAALLAEMGDTAGAIAWLDPTLNALAATAPSLFDDATRAASLVRAMALRAEAARAGGDTASAERWGAAVRVLWKNADSAIAKAVNGLVVQQQEVRS